MTPKPSTNVTKLPARGKAAPRKSEADKQATKDAQRAKQIEAGKQARRTLRALKALREYGSPDQQARLDDLLERGSVLADQHKPVAATPEERKATSLRNR